MTKITNATILSAFRKQMGLSKADATAFADAFQSVFEEALLNDKSVKINGLGTFKLVEVEARKSVNVNTGKEIQIAEHYKLTFTPDAALRDKINEPLAHLETIELDDDLNIVDVVAVQAIDHESIAEPINEPANEPIVAEEPIDEPLQKLVEQAMELKDILADIQSLGGVAQDSEPETPITAEVSSSEEPQQEEKELQVELKDDSLQDEKEPFVVEIESQPETQEEVQEETQEEKREEVQEEVKTQDTIELPQLPLEEPKAPVSPVETTTTSAVSARDIVAEINKDDGTPKRKMLWLWFSLSIVLVLSIVALLLYQNRDFFITTPDVEPISADVLVDTMADSESLNQPEEKLLPIEQDSVIETIDTIVEVVIPEEVSQHQIDTASPIYNAQFSDLFNRTRNYTEYIDTVTLNEGSRLTWIAFKQYGHKDFWVYIYEANHDIISNPNSIKIGTKLRIPKVDSTLINPDNQQCIDYARYLHDVYVKK